MKSLNYKIIADIFIKQKELKFLFFKCQTAGTNKIEMLSIKFRTLLRTPGSGMVKLHNIT